MLRKKRAYFDYAAATPLGRAAVNAMKPFLKEGLNGSFGNASSVHSTGLEAKKVIEKARKEMALKLAIHPDEIIFTSGGTESANLAILGTFKKAKNIIKNPHIISSQIEHSSVITPINIAENEGARVTLVPPDKNGIINADEIALELTPETILVSISLVNGELGTISPIRNIGNLIKKYKESLGRNENDYPYLYTDASQAGSLLSLSPHNFGVDMLTMDASKMYGPKGAGALIKLRERNITPIIFGGGQEQGIRSGTENVPTIVGMSEAFLEAESMREKEWERLEKLKSYFISEVEKKIPKATFNTLSQKQLPSFLSVCIPGLNAEFAVIELDVRGIAASSASACQTIGGTGSSYVIKALPQGKNCASSSIRFSMGRFTNKKDIDLAAEALKEISL